MLVREEQPLNAPLSMLVTLLGIVKFSKELQYANASSLIIFKLLEKTTVFKELHHQYLQPVITQYFASNKSEIWS